jgi:RNA polymerase sigma-70 factor, ECF subfamily
MVTETFSPEPMEAALSQVKKLERTAAGRQSGDPDATALERVRAGDLAAFADLVRRHQRAVYFLCLRYVRQEEDAADLTQRALVRSYEKIGSFGGRSSFRTWLFRIAVNLCLNAIRDRDRRPTVGLADQTVAVPASQHDDLDHFERRVWLRRAVELLPPKQRMTVILRIYHEFPFSEVAEIMDVSEGSAKVNYHHAMGRLRSLQAPEG